MCHLPPPPRPGTRLPDLVADVAGAARAIARAAPRGAVELPAGERARASSCLVTVTGWWCEDDRPDPETTHVSSRHSTGELASLESLVTNAADPNNAVFALFFGRACDALEQLALLPPRAPHSASATAAAARGGGAAATSPPMRDDVRALIEAKGFAPFEAELADVGGALRSLLAHTVAVGARHYDVIIRDALAASATAATVAP